MPVPSKLTGEINQRGCVAPRVRPAPGIEPPTPATVTNRRRPDTVAKNCATAVGRIGLCVRSYPGSNVLDRIPGLCHDPVGKDIDGCETAAHDGVGRTAAAHRVAHAADHPGRLHLLGRPQARRGSSRGGHRVTVLHAAVTGSRRTTGRHHPHREAVQRTRRVDRLASAVPHHGCHRGEHRRLRRHRRAGYAGARRWADRRRVGTSDDGGPR